MPTLRTRGILFIALVVMIGLPVSKTLVHLLTESWWFEAVGFAEVFWTRLTWQVLLWVFTFVAYSFFLWGNYQIALHRTRNYSFRFLEYTEFESYTDTIAHYLALAATILVALGAAAASTTDWETVLKFLNPSEFGSRDPVLQQEISFYVFRLPFYEGLRHWLLLLLLWGLILSILVYSFKGTLTWRPGRNGRPPMAAKSHLSLLLAGIALLMAWGFWLARYQLLVTPSGTVFGAGYTDVHARLFANQLMTIMSLLAAVLLVLLIWRRGFALLLGTLGVFFVVLILVDGVYPWFLQQFIVNPNELAKEKPYLEHNIQFTQAAYGLTDVQRQTYAAETQLNRQVLQANQPTIRNIRLWDNRPLLSTYRQLQEIRLYYKFKGVDVDRYQLNGGSQQVMLSAREMAISQLPLEAQTWVNQRLKFTHGYGLVMSPVNQTTSDGLPQLYIKDIPPTAQVDLPVTQPAIYYGEETDNYVFTGTNTEELDYPLGNRNAVTQYSGTGGVSMPSAWHRLAYAYDQSSLQILISNYFTSQSRIHYYRQIQARVSHIAPFLRFDGDPYLVLINGRLQWLVDAYTVSDRYPYAEPVAYSKNAAAILGQGNTKAIVQGNVNYIRNSVKVLVDAYDGTLQFFAVDETDPVLATYRNIFPNLFTPDAQVPPAVRAHFRYPEDLFEIQAQMYLSYHMRQPEVFYNREDLWRFPIQTYEGNEVMMQPYYVIMRLPGESNPEFMLILPFTPANKDNMIAWMAARSNGKNYGKLLLYEFPKQKLVYGPRQIEARIDQDPQISQQFTLWSQAGSKVIRGDLLVIPIDQSLLYVEPVYLRAEQGGLPQLKRAIVAYDKAVVMAESLDQALTEIFGGKPTTPKTSVTEVVQGATQIQTALETYKKSQEALRRGNWGEYGRYQQELGRILQQLNPSQNP